MKQKKFQKLRGKITEKGFLHADLASKLRISPTSFSYKMGGKVDFTLSEIKYLYSLLGIAPNEIFDYFFT